MSKVTEAIEHLKQVKEFEATSELSLGDIKYEITTHTESVWLVRDDNNMLELTFDEAQELMKFLETNFK